MELTRRVLPEMAGERRWPIRNDHCFQRVLLDAVFAGVWYAHVPERPAYRTMTDEALVRAVELADGVAAGTIDLPELDRRSLAYRGKPSIKAR